MSEDGLTARVPVTVYGGAPSSATIDAEDIDLATGWNWYLSTRGYAIRATYDARTKKPGRVALHRLILGLMPRDGIEADHINRDRLDNRRANLRAVPAMSANRQNRPSQRGASSQYRGVSWNRARQKWQAEVNAVGNRTYLGLFETEEEAAEVARAARRRLMPYATD